MQKIVSRWLKCILQTGLLLLPLTSLAQAIPQQQEITTELRPAPLLSLPSGRLGVDCNSPVEWGNDGNLIVFTSFLQPYRSTGPSLFTLATPAAPVTIFNAPGITGGKWLEATYRMENGTLYGWYHNEPPSVCSNNGLTAPRIGAVVSNDDGLTWQDLGIIIEAPSDALNCSSVNRYFAGGNGDFSVILDREREYFYFLFSTYHRQVHEQGVTVARMSFADLNAPVGKVWKWYNGGWQQPGLRGRVSMIFPGLIDWHRSNANAYWGPAVHYNTYLNRYVMLLNHAYDREWSQEGIYICYNEDLADPQGWSAPQRLPLFPARAAFYPEIIGIQPGETDKLAGRVARLFLLGSSSWEIEFERPDNCGNALDGDDNETPCGPEPLVSPPLRPARGMPDYPRRNGTE
jgi:hypothetical protein